MRVQLKNRSSDIDCVILSLAKYGHTRIRIRTNSLIRSPMSARPQRRKKATNEDASYVGPSGSTAGSKRQAADRADGEPRAKRKRVVDPSGLMAAPPPKAVESEIKMSKVRHFTQTSGSYAHALVRSTFLNCRALSYINI